MKTGTRILIIYLAIGFLYNMVGEYRLTEKYIRLNGNDTPMVSVLNKMLYDPSVYVRSIIFSASWPIDLYETLCHRVGRKTFYE